MPSDCYMLDTTEFNAVAKGVIPLSTYAGFRVFATHVQLDELKNTQNEQKRAQLISSFEGIGPETLPTETALWAISKWNEAKWSADDGLFDRMLTRLIELDGRDRGENQRRDILIAETATSIQSAHNRRKNNSLPAILGFECCSSLFASVGFSATC